MLMNDLLTNIVSEMVGPFFFQSAHSDECA